MGVSRRIGPPPDHIIETDVDGDVSLYDPQTENVMVLNRTASDIWLLSDGDHSLAEIVELLAKAYAVQPADIRDDVAAAVAAFVENGFLSDGDAE